MKFNSWAALAAIIVTVEMIVIVSGLIIQLSQHGLDVAQYPVLQRF